jgi:hypothetical protein
MRCYFHLVSCHDAILDQTGVEVTDLAAAEVQAIRAVHELREEDPDADEDWQGWQLNVTGTSGHLLLSIPLDTEPREHWSHSAVAGLDRDDGWGNRLPLASIAQN